MILLEIIINIIFKLLNNNKLKNLKNFKKIKNKAKYLVNLGNCISCHTINGGKPFGGGYSIKTNFGIINSPNITSDKTNGIGKLKLKEFIKIMREGISKNGDFITPAFPYKNFSKIKKKNLKEIFIFLKNIKKENVINKKNKLNFPIQYKKLIIFSRIIFFKKKNLIKKKIKSNIKRGKYITNALGHCNMCHTKMNKLGKINNFFKHKGLNLIEGWETNEINSNKNIKNIKTIDIYKLLKFGLSKNKIIGGTMIDVVENSLQYASEIDIISISKYIKNVINKKKILKIKKINKKNLKLIKKKILIYKKECKNCHGKLNLGNYPIFPKLIKFQEIKLKNMKVILKLNNTLNTIKNKYAGIMKNFKNIKEKKIKVYIEILKNLKKN